MIVDSVECELLVRRQRDGLDDQLCIGVGRLGVVLEEPSQDQKSVRSLRPKATLIAVRTNQMDGRTHLGTVAPRGVLLVFRLRVVVDQLQLGRADHAAAHPVARRASAPRAGGTRVCSAAVKTDKTDKELLDHKVTTLVSRIQLYRALRHREGSRAIKVVSFKYDVILLRRCNRCSAVLYVTKANFFSALIKYLWIHKRTLHTGQT